MKKKYVICKTCGYIVEEGKVHDVCPACGAPAGAFDPYVPTMTKKREFVLSFHMHPIILHFTQAVVVFSFLFILACMIFKGSVYDFVLVCAQFTTVILPLCVLAGAVTGIIDGKFRFKRVTTPLLMKKIILSIVFLITSLAAALLILLAPLTTGILAVMLVLALVSSIVAFVLGKMGSPLMTSSYPG